jgi:hypothetical protein
MTHEMTRERIEAHVEKLNQARQFLLATLSKIAERGDEQIYSDGAQWTVRQLAIHILIADKGHNAMILGAARGESIIPEDYDLERFNKRSVDKSAEMTLEQVEAGLIHTRAELLTWLAEQNDSVLDKQARHATLRIMSISQMLDIMAWHETTHSTDIRKHLEQAV